MILIPTYGLVGAGITQMFGFLALCILTHLWNRRQGKRYLQISYPWSRILMFPPIFVAYLVITMWPRNTSIYGEILVSSFLLLPIPLLFFVLLDQSERNRGMDLARKMLSRIGVLAPSTIVDSPAQQ